jgi:hypothetical protein
MEFVIQIGTHKSNKKWFNFFLWSELILYSTKKWLNFACLIQSIERKDYDSVFLIVIKYSFKKKNWYHLRFYGKGIKLCVLLIGYW